MACRVIDLIKCLNVSKSGQEFVQKYQYFAMVFSKIIVLRLSTSNVVLYHNHFLISCLFYKFQVSAIGDSKSDF